MSSAVTRSLHRREGKSETERGVDARGVSDRIRRGRGRGNAQRGEEVGERGVTECAESRVDLLRKRRARLESMSRRRRRRRLSTPLSSSHSRVTRDRMNSLSRTVARLSLSRPSPRPLPSSSRNLSSSPSSPSTLSPYPFSSTATVLPLAPAPPSPRTDSLLRTLNSHLTAQHPKANSYLPLFSRRDKNRLLPGSVITVTSYAAPPTPENPSPATTVFSGVLIALRRRHAGRDTSIRLRNLVGRIGVEVSFKVFSPLIKDIKVVQRAETSGPAVVGKDGKELQRRKAALPAAKRAKMYFVREQPNRFVFTFLPFSLRFLLNAFPPSPIQARVGGGYRPCRS